MSGGINDALALYAADAGISVKQAVDVGRESVDPRALAEISSTLIVTLTINPAVDIST